MERVTRRIGDIVEFVDGKGYANLTQQEEKRLLLNILAESEDKLEKREPMLKLFNLENKLHEQKDKTLEIKASMYWGALTIVHQSGYIDWDNTRKLFGEFMSIELNLR